MTRTSLKPITRLEANLIAQRALYRLGPRGKLWPGSESLEIERLWIPFAQLTYNAVNFRQNSFPEHFLLLLGISELYREFHPVSSTFHWFFFFNLREGRREGTREICSIWTESRWIWFGEFFRSIVGIVSNKYGGGRGTRCFKREIN